MLAYTLLPGLHGERFLCETRAANSVRLNVLPDTYNDLVYHDLCA